ncbi:Low temperature requirement A [Sarocladium implicatum]|nr:Low temperature requirement A [Sarocladium implicatum]
MEQLSYTDEEDLRRATPRVRLQWMKSPVVGSTESHDSFVQAELPDVGPYQKNSTLGAAGFATYRGEARGLPVFRRVTTVPPEHSVYKRLTLDARQFEEASLLELFTDLFFAANYEVFTRTQDVIDGTSLASYIGYFGTLWITWFLVALYDVRFVTDCVFERVTRAVHLAVLIGFAVVAPKFDPADQDKSTMRAMSIILSISRFTLGVEYLSVLWHVRKFKQALLPIGLQAGFSFACSFVYLGVTFRFRDHNSRAFVVWYIVAAVELVTTTAAAAWFDVLMFTRTHLMKRLTLLTVIILGDGVIVLAGDVVTIAETPDAWNPLIIGVVTASCAAIYCVFLVYFDWFREQYLPRWRQIYWVALHLPFHLALVLFMHGFTQLIMWTKILDVIHRRVLIRDGFLQDYDRISQMSSLNVSQAINEEVGGFLDSFAKYNGWATVIAGVALQNITKLPDSLWSEHPQIIYAAYYGLPLDDGFEKSQTFLDFQTAIKAILATMLSAIFETFGVEVLEDLAEKRDEEGDAAYVVTSGFQQGVVDESLSRFQTVFIYGYICSGLTLILMTVLTVIARKRPWTTWPIARNIVNVLVGIMMAGLCALVFSGSIGPTYVRNGLAVPTMTIVWFFILILTHMSTATPIVGRAFRTMSGLSGDSTTEKARGSSQETPAAKRSLGGHTSGGVSLGHMTFRGRPAKTSRERQTSFHGQVRDDETSCNADRYSHDQDAHDPMSGHSISTAAGSTQISTYDERYPNSPPVMSRTLPGSVDRQDTVTAESYAGHRSTDHPHHQA